jgi:hypothetical protein
VPILRDVVIHYAGTDLTATANEVALDFSAADLDVTTFGSSGNHERIAGLEDVSASVMTFGDPAIVEPIFSTKPGTVELLTVTQFPTAGTATVGDRIYAMRGLLTSTKQPLKVGDVKNRSLRLGDIDTIKIEADGGFPSDCRVDRDRSANSDLRDGLVRRSTFDLHIGRDRAQRVDRIDPARFEKLRAYSRNGDRHVLDVLRALLCRDDDLANAIVGIL